MAAIATTTPITVVLFFSIKETTPSIQQPYTLIQTEAHTHKYTHKCIVSSSEKDKIYE